MLALKPMSNRSPRIGTSPTSVSTATFQPIRARSVRGTPMRYASTMM